jgi:Uma2 family endonuclease
LYSEGVPTFTLAEYIELESRAQYKNEFCNGEIRPMRRPTVRHDDVAMQLIVLIGSHLRGSHCRCYTARLRVATPGEYYTYPDLSVVCGHPEFSSKDPDALVNPTMLVEIVSPESEDYDLGFKAYMYRDVPTLRELLLVTQDRYEVEHYQWQPDGSWLLRYCKGLDAVVELPSIGYTLQTPRAL